MNHAAADNARDISKAPSGATGQTAPRERVLCRLPASNWWGVFSSVVLGLLSLTLLFVEPASKKPGDYLTAAIVVWCLSTLFWMFAAWLALSIERSFIYADAEKLCWRGIGKWHAVRWADVSDFYHANPVNSKMRIVETSDGTLKISPGWTNERVLTDWIARHATSAKSTVWEERGVRPEDPWPRTHHYRTFDNRFMPWLAALVSLAPVAMIGSKFNAQNSVLRDIYALYGWPMIALMIVTGLGIYAIYPVMFGAMLGPVVRAARARQTQSIVTTPETIRWSDGTRAIEANWNEVTDFYQSPLPGRISSHVLYEVETTHGNFDFVHSIGNSRQLCRTVARHATQARAIREDKGEWRLRLANGDQSTSSRKSEDPYPLRDAARPDWQLFGYRTAMVRALLWLPSALAAVPILLPVLLRWVQPIDVDAAIPGVPDNMRWMWMAISAGIVAWMWWCYRESAIEIDAAGLKQHTAFGVKTLAWKEVQKYFVSGDSFGNVVGRNKHGETVRIRFWQGIGGERELRSEIERRAPVPPNPSWLAD